LVAALIGRRILNGMERHFTGTDDLSIDIAQQWCPDGIRR